MRHVAKGVKDSIRRVQYERIWRELYSAIQLARGQCIVALDSMREQARKLTVDSYEVTFHDVGINRVCAYLSADWEACNKNKK
jgi:hypothetical protein